jgi:transcription antitermination factor NusG
MEHQKEHGNTGKMAGRVGAESLDSVSGDGVTVTAMAPGARHPECGAIPETQCLIRPDNDLRRGPGRRWAKPASVVVSAGGPRWYCIETAARSEDMVAALLDGMGFEAFAPKFLDRVAARPEIKRAAHDVLRPAFPGYVLAEFDAADGDWRRIASVRGVRRVMGSAPERPSAIPAVKAAWLIAQFGPGGVQLRSRVDAPAATPIEAGRWVRVNVGPYDGVRGRVLESDGRAVVLTISGWRVRVAQAAVDVLAE